MSRTLLLKFFIVVLIALLPFCNAFGQDLKTITLDDCHTLAKSQYPLAKQKALIERSKEFSIENASKAYFPQVSLNGQASYQSDVTKVEIPIPTIEVPVPDKDQYRIYGEVIQPVTDMIIFGKQKELTEANSMVENQKLGVELYKLKERINNLFFGILLLDDQLELSELLRKDFVNALIKVNAAIENGVSAKNSADLLKAELLKLDQRKIEILSAKKSFASMLSLFINLELDDSTNFAKPPESSLTETILRPEIPLFESQKQVFLIQNKILTAKSLPRSSLFLQGGFGKPAFNLFSNQGEFYYTGGIRFSWMISSFYTMKNERSILSLNNELIDSQKETFLFNTRISMQQQKAEIDKLQLLIQKDEEIIQLRTEIKNSASKQLENGVITATDYLREANAEDQARQNLIVHRTQLLAAKFNFKAITGN